MCALTGSLEQNKQTERGRECESSNEADPSNIWDYNGEDNLPNMHASIFPPMPRSGGVEGSLNSR